jgi:biopolymer transport protein ExbD
MNTFSLPTTSVQNHTLRTFAAIAFLWIASPIFAQNMPDYSSKHHVQGQKHSSSEASVPAREKLRAVQIHTEKQHNKGGYALSAEELSTALPELVRVQTQTLPSPHPRMPHLVTTKTVKEINYEAVVKLLVKATQEQHEEIEQLRNEIASLKAQTRK